MKNANKIKVTENNRQSTGRNNSPAGQSGQHERGVVVQLTRFHPLPELRQHFWCGVVDQPGGLTVILLGQMLCERNCYETIPAHGQFPDQGSLRWAFWPFFDQALQNTSIEIDDCFREWIDRVAYTNGKAAFIRRITVRARKSHNSAPAPPATAPSVLD